MLKMFTYANVLKWIPGAKPREYKFSSWDRRSEHCIQLQKYRHDLEKLVTLTSSLKEVEDNEERKVIIDSLPPIPELPEINSNTSENNAIEEIELSEESVISLLSKAAARIFLIIGYTDAPPYLLEELSKIVKDYLKSLILKCCVAAGPISLEGLEEALQEMGINGVEELQSFYLNRIVKFHNNLYSKCKKLRTELENNMKIPSECPNSKHSFKRKKSKNRNVETKEENKDDLSLESGETVEVLFIRKLMKSNTFVKEEDKKDLKKIKCDTDIPRIDSKKLEKDLNQLTKDVDIPSADQKLCEIDSKSTINIKEGISSNFVPSKDLKNDQIFVKEEFEESDKKLLDKYAAFFTFEPMSRKPKSDFSSKDQLKKELKVKANIAKNCNSLVEKEDKKHFPILETKPISKLTNKEKIVQDTFEKLCNVPKSDVNKSPSLSEKCKNPAFEIFNSISSSESDTEVLNKSNISISEETEHLILTPSLKIGNQKNKMLDNSDTNFSNFSKTTNKKNINSVEKDFSQNLKSHLLRRRSELKKQVKFSLSTLDKNDNATLNKSSCKGEEFSEMNILEENKIAENIIKKDTLFCKQNTEIEKYVSLPKLHELCCSGNANRKNILIIKRKEIKTLDKLIDKPLDDSSTEKGNQYSKPDLKRKKHKLNNNVSDLKNIYESERNCTEDFNVRNSKLNKVSCCQATVKSEEGLLLNSNDFNHSKDDAINKLDNDTIFSLSGNETICPDKILEQDSHSTNDLKCGSKSEPVRKKRKLRKKEILLKQLEQKEKMS